VESRRQAAQEHRRRRIFLPDIQELATETVLKQAEMLANELTKSFA
jgi:hypothetical protein